MDSKDDKANWSPPKPRLEVGAAPQGVNAKRVQGRRLTGPQQGFGQLWQKTYKVAIPQKTPEQVIATWKAEYGRFWPAHSKFYAPVTGIKPGEVGLIKSTSGPVPLSTGVLVLYSDDVSFCYMTPEGHPFAGFITFSSHVEDPVGTMAQVQLLIRANDPAYEAGMMLFGSKAEDRMWEHTLHSLADYLGSSSPVDTKVVRVDQKRLWKNFSNLKYNGALPWARRSRGPATPPR
ncbi:MAG: hypothetical protein ACR2ME_09435 [Acidimicrobiia bacterium]